jgi:hypothetical protein
VVLQAIIVQLMMKVLPGLYQHHFQLAIGGLLQAITIR